MFEAKIYFNSINNYEDEDVQIDFISICINVFL